MIGIIGAMKIETDMLKNAMTDKEISVYSGIEFVKGKLGKCDAVVASCGVGKVFAAMCAQTMILKFSPDVVINTGVGGGVGEGLHIGDIVIAEKLVQHDMDVCGLGCAPGEHMELRQVYFPCDENTVNTVKTAAEKLGFTVKTGVIASGDQFISDDESKVRLKNLFNAQVCEMEGASIAQVCYVNEVPFAVIRAISDGADDDAKMSFEDFAKMAAKRSCDVLFEMTK